MQWKMSTIHGGGRTSAAIGYIYKFSSLNNNCGGERWLFVDIVITLMVFWDHCGAIERNWDLNQESWVLFLSKTCDHKWVTWFLWDSLSSLVQWGLTTALKFHMMFWLLTTLKEGTLKFQHINTSPHLTGVEANPLQWSWLSWLPCIVVVVWRHEQKGQHLESPSRQLGRTLQRTLS